METKDSKDPRLGEFVSVYDVKTPLEQALKGVNAVLIGWPDDRGIALNKGRPGAAAGPSAIRKAFYRFTPGIHSSFSAETMLDYGDLVPLPDLGASHQKAAEIVESIAKAGKTIVTLGGGNDYAYADVLGISRASGKSASTGVINIDAHFDVRDLRFGLTSGTPYFRLLDEKIVEGKNFVEFGIQPHRNSPHYYDWLEKHGVEILSLETLRERGIRKVFYLTLTRLCQTCDQVVVSLDMDVVRQADAPGVSAPSPNGLSAEDVEGIAMLAGKEKKVKLFSVYEVSPPLDRDNQTATLAASTVWNFLHSR